MKIFIPALLASFFIAGCGGVSYEDIQEAKGRLEILKREGLPDSLLTPAMAQIADAKDAHNRGQNKRRAFHYNEAIKLIEHSENARVEAKERLKPLVNAAVADFTKESSEKLTGLHLKAAEEAISNITDLQNAGSYWQAEREVRRFRTTLRTLEQEEAKAAEILPKLYGTWRYIDTASNVEHPEINAIERKRLEFGRDGRAEYHHSISGQDAPNQRVRRHYSSYGTFALKGDEIQLSIDRFITHREEVQTLDITDPNAKWVTTISNNPSTEDITDGSQDLSVRFNTLTYEYQKTR